MADTQKKAEKMGKKSEDFHRMFTAPDSETVIQDYSCMLNGVFGRLYISQNIVGYYSSFPERLEKIMLVSVTDVQKDRGLLFQGISITHNKSGTENKLLFTNFSHRDEVYELIAYLWKNPPSYVSVDQVNGQQDQLGQVTVKRSSVTEPTSVLQKRSTESNDTFTNSSGYNRPVSSYASFGNYNSIYSSGSGLSGSPSYDWNRNAGSLGASTSAPGKDQDQMLQLQPQTRVDVEKAREAVRMAYSIRETTADTINTVDLQGQQLGRIEAHMDNIAANLDKSETLIRGMESVFAYIGNKWGKNKSKPPPIADYGNRAIKIEKAEPPCDMEILCKNPDDSFTPALLRMHTMGFACVDPDTGKPLNPSYSWPYSDVVQLVVRARHEHLDIKFSQSSGKERFRFMSSYLQLAVNEIILRSPQNQVQVVFEPGTRQFEFGIPTLSKIPPSSRAAAKSGFSRTDNTVKTSSLLSATADQQTKNDLDEVDSHLDEVSRIVGDIGDMQTALGKELEVQNEQLDRVSAKTDDNNTRLQAHTKRMNQLMS